MQRRIQDNIVCAHDGHLRHRHRHRPPRQASPTTLQGARGFTTTLGGTEHLDVFEHDLIVSDTEPPGRRAKVHVYLGNPAR